ncbi:L-threonylcarbamoyladenylate synthase [Aquibacillus salsiterrae]|uniref:Threonylcarbamoyl-AMP synthase n=1 Tax=Aquibacillus salsiterrae TaxID=2950439 RepID=A0A9X3WBQ9_9BACI|nr:L-threonylcarbamoyladenylate synthase [Aquibacillus salsiterrae]MDC3416747.1 L-threonylcarbamoyladenylate synthase [Aquibacillus salsiterrae]
METKWWKIDENQLDKKEAALNQAANLLHNEEVVAFPTETVYGLGADATKEAAVAKIFVAKGRQKDNPLIVHVASIEQINDYVTEIPEVAKRLLAAFAPGPITVILPSNGTIAANVTAGLSTVAFRIPDHPVAKQLLTVSQLPLAAPSANKSGKPSPTKAEHVIHDLDGKIAGVVDGGATGVGLESTVVDCTSELPVILRPGGITLEQLRTVVDNIIVDQALVKQVDQPKAPGMKYNHYEPDAPLWLVAGDTTFFQAQINQLEQAGQKVGVMCSTELSTQLTARLLIPCGSKEMLAEVAVNLYDTLRFFNKEKVDVILCEMFPEVGVGQAIMNRLEKAATKVVHQQN